MIKEEEIEYYRNNVINKYVDAVMFVLDLEEKSIRDTQITDLNIILIINNVKDAERLSY